MAPCLEHLYALFLSCNQQVETDTRHIKQGDIFFALPGTNFNGNDFAIKALQKGASYAVVSNKQIAQQDNRCIWVEDVLYTMQQLALLHRNKFSIPIIAITGSNGKTTTKELVAGVLSSHFCTHATAGNFNNHIGIPLTLLRMKENTEIAVIEMGASHQKEIASYCTFTHPTHGIITNCGKAHLGGFGGVEGIRKGKGELFDYLSTFQDTCWLKNNPIDTGEAFICSDLDYLFQMATMLKKRMLYGTSAGEVIGQVMLSNPYLSVCVTKGLSVNPTIIQTHLIGEYNIFNVLCAIAVGIYFKVPADKIVASIASYIPKNNRSQLMEWNHNNVIADFYNANPTSMQLAIKNFIQQPYPKKALIIGSMIDLGEESEKEHQQIINQIKDYTWASVILIGFGFKDISHPYQFFNTAKEASVWIKQQSWHGYTILIKGSRAMQLEQILDISLTHL